MYYKISMAKGTVLTSLGGEEEGKDAGKTRKDISNQ